MNKIFNLTSTFKTHEQDDGSVMIRGMASTADFKNGLCLEINNDLLIVSITNPGSSHT